MSLLKKNPYPWLVLVLSLFAWAPLLTPAYFFNAHDAKHSVFFLVEFDQTFRDGYLWPRWSPDFAFGYGYPLFNLYAPLAFYAAQLLHLLGLDFTTAIKTMYILATIGAGLGMYGLTGRLFGRPAGLLAAVVYLYAPFHLVEIFVRSAYAEFVALTLVPFVFWTFTNLITAPSTRRLALAALTYGLLALTHHTTFVTFSPLLAIYSLFLILLKTKFNLKYLYTARVSLWDGHSSLTSNLLLALGAGLLGLALAAIYLIPMLAETRYIKIEQWTSGSYSYLQHFVYFAQLFSPEWGYGYAGPGLADDFSLQLGIVAVALFCFALVNLAIHSFINRAVAIFFTIAALVIIFLMSPLAEPVWQMIPIATLVQFPWRLLGMTAFIIALVAGSLLAQDSVQLSMNNEQISTLQPSNLLTFNLPICHLSNLYLICLVVILASFGYTLPQYTTIPAWAQTPLAVVNWDRASIVDRVGMVSVTQEQPQTSPMEQQYLNGQPLTAAGIIAGQGQVETLHRGGASTRVRVIADEPVTLQFYTYEYPGWQVYLNNQPLIHRFEPPYGLVTVDVPAGAHELRLQMETTLPRTLGAIISSLALVAIVALLLFNRTLPTTA